MGKKGSKQETAKKSPMQKKTVKGKPKIKKKISAKKAVKKEVKKVKAKVKKKTTKRVKVKAEVKKKPVQQVKAKIKKEEKVKKKKVAIKEVKKVLRKPEKKVKAKKVTEPKKEIKVEAKKVVVPRKEVSRKLKKVIPAVIKGKYPPLPVEILPEEYGEDSVALMTVDPRKLFIYWEVSQDSIDKYIGDINVRVYDVTGIDFDGTNAHGYFDMLVGERIGSQYIDVAPEREYIVDVGIIDPSGVFVSIARSNKVLTPREGIAEKEAFPHELYETGLPEYFR